MSVSAATSIGTGKAPAIPTASGSATSDGGAAPAGGATAEAAAGVGVAAGERAGTGSTEESEVRKSHTPTQEAAAATTTAQGTQECRCS